LLAAVENEAASLFSLGKKYECPYKLRKVPLRTKTDAKSLPPVGRSAAADVPYRNRNNSRETRRLLQVLRLNGSTDPPLVVDSLLTAMSTFVDSEKRIDATISSPRWFQFSCLQKSTGDEQHHDHRDAASHSRDSSRGENDGGTSGKETDEHVVGGSEGVPLVSTETAQSRELGFLVAKVTDKTHRNIGCGAIAKLVEIFKENLEKVEGRSLEAVLEDHISMFAHPSTKSILFEGPLGMPRGGPLLARK
jgi:hypothetical protein